jgi:hypothetical protein
MTNKKKYQAPAFKVIKLKSLSNLLCGSVPADEEADEQEGN